MLLEVKPPRRRKYVDCENKMPLCPKEHSGYVECY